MTDRDELAHRDNAVSLLTRAKFSKKNYKPAFKKPIITKSSDNPSFRHTFAKETRLNPHNKIKVLVCSHFHKKAS